jgi:20S proteasome alpha/beta subunit
MPYSSRLIKARKAIEKPKMTCIIGRVCEDGVVLIADRKIIEENGNEISEEKIFMDFHPFVLACSGYTTQIRNIRRDAKKLCQSLLGVYNEKDFQPQKFDYQNVSGIAFQYPNITPYPIVPIYDFLEALKNPVTKYNKEDGHHDYYSAVLVGIQEKDSRRASLHCIDESGTQGDIIDQIVIGSGDRYASFFLASFRKWKFKMEDFAELGFFVIKYIDRFRIDTKVGLLGELPLVWFIPHTNPITKVEDKNLLEIWNKKTEETLNNFEKDGINKLLDQVCDDS